MIPLINQTFIPDCYEIISQKLNDDRGFFYKTYNSLFFNNNKIGFQIKEIYHSYSINSVLRGLHFQLPPKHLFKLVSCIIGEVFDVVVDLRKGSPTFSHYCTFFLNTHRGNSILIPPGCAHGFFVLSEYALLSYHVSEVFDASCDTGILWNSIDIPWPTKNPLTSTRDQNFVPFSDFVSPFVYEEK